MQKIILISGFGGTGKSTVSQLLHDKLANNAQFEADFLFNIKPFEIGEKLGRIKIRNSLALLQTFLEEGYENIIVVGFVFSQSELESIISNFGNQAKIILVWLEASKECRFNRVIKRGNPGDTLEFLEEVEAKIKYPWPFKEGNYSPLKISVEEKNSQQICEEIIQHFNLQ